MDNIKSQDISRGALLFMWFSLVLAYFLNFFHSLCISVLQPYIIESFKLDPLQVASIGSMYFYAYIVMQIPTGILVDKFGSRFVVTAGCLLTFAGASLFSFASSLVPLYIGRALVGIGTSVTFICLLKFQLAWIPPRLMLTATGIAVFIGIMGGVLAQTPLVYLISKFGWRTSLFAIGFASLLNAVATFFIKDKEAEDTLYKPIKPNFVESLKKILLNINFYPPFIFYTIFYGSYFLIMGYSGNTWLEQVHNYDKSTAANLMSLGVVGAAIAGIIIGWWSDKIDSRKIPMLTFGIIFLFIWGVFAWLGPELPTYLIGALIFSIGFFNSAYVVCWVCIQRYNPSNISGLAIATYNMGGFIGGVVMPYVYAYILVKGGSDDITSSSQFALKVVFFILLFAVLVGTRVKDIKENEI